MLGLTARYLRAHRHGPGKKCRYRQGQSAQYHRERSVIDLG